MVARLHAERYPDGCPGYCMACVERVKPLHVACPAGCGNQNLYAQGGKVVEHDRMVGGRRNYRARPQRCDGSGAKVNTPRAGASE